MKRALLLVGVGLAVAGLLALGVAGSSSRSSLDRGAGGYAAFAAAAVRAGHPVRSLRLGLHVLGRAETGLLVMAPAPGLVTWPVLTAGDIDRVLRWVELGGALLLMRDADDALTRALGVTFAPSDDAWPPSEAIAAAPVAPSLLTRGGALSAKPALALVGQSVRPLFSVQGRVIAAQVTRGRGRVVVVTDPDLFGNANLAVGGNLEFGLALLEELGGVGGPIHFDDLHAGGGDDHGVVAYARGAGGGPALLVGFIGVLLLLWRMGARARPVATPGRPPGPAAGPGQEEALADLYRRAGLSRHALTVTSRRFRAQVEARAGARWQPESIEPWVRSELGNEAAQEFSEVRAHFARLFAQPKVPIPEVVEVARLAARFEARWLHRRGARERLASVYGGPLAERRAPDGE